MLRSRAVFFVLGVTAVDVAVVACSSEDTHSVSPIVDDDAARAAKDGAIDRGIDAGEPIADATSDGDATKPWPTCNTKPASAAKKTIPEIWQANPTKETEVWIEGAYVTAISGGECAANEACQIFVQADTGYASLAAAQKHAIKIFVSSAVTSKFGTVSVGDRVNVLGWAWRYDLNGQHELLVQVNALLPGCAKTTSTNTTLTPLEGLSLSDLTVAGYEDTYGPLFVKIANVGGKADASPTATFGLFDTTTDAGSSDAGSGANIVSLSPFFLPGGTFTGTGLVPGAITKFNSITAVFGLFVPNGGPKYLELYPRVSADLDKQ